MEAARALGGDPGPLRLEGADEGLRRRGRGQYRRGADLLRHRPHQGEPLQEDDHALRSHDPEGHDLQFAAAVRGYQARRHRR